MFERWTTAFKEWGCKAAFDFALAKAKNAEQKKKTLTKEECEGVLPEGK